MTPAAHRIRRAARAWVLLAGMLVAMCGTRPAVALAVAVGAPGPVIASGEVLTAGQIRGSANGQVQLQMQSDGDLVISSQGTRIWHSNTGGRPGASLRMQVDGNAVIRDAAGFPRWASRSFGHRGATLTLGDNGLLSVLAARSPVWTSKAFNSRLTAGHLLRSGWSLTAPGGRVVTVMQPDGDLVTRRDGTTLWRSHTNGHPGAYASLQSDGNLVVRGRDAVALWASRTYGYAGARVEVQADSYLVVYSQVGAPVWWRDIGRGATLCNSTSPSGSGTSVTRWHPVELCVLAVLRQSSANLSDVDLMIQWESSGDANAVNLWDSNAKAGHPSKGLIQVIQPTFDRFRSLQLSADLFNPAANLYAGLNYAVYTYGSIHNIPGLVSLRNGGGYKGYAVP